MSEVAQFCRDVSDIIMFIIIVAVAIFAIYFIVVTISEKIGKARKLDLLQEYHFKDDFWNYRNDKLDLYFPKIYLDDIPYRNIKKQILKRIEEEKQDD